MKIKQHLMALKSSINELSTYMKLYLLLVVINLVYDAIAEPDFTLILADLAILTLAIALAACHIKVKRLELELFFNKYTRKQKDFDQLPELISLLSATDWNYSLTHQQINGYSMEIYTGHKKSYQQKFYTDGHLSPKLPIGMAITFMKGQLN